MPELTVHPMWREDLTHAEIDQVIEWGRKRRRETEEHLSIKRAEWSTRHSPEDVAEIERFYVGFNAHWLAL